MLPAVLALWVSPRARLYRTEDFFPRGCTLLYRCQWGMRGDFSTALPTSVCPGIWWDWIVAMWWVGGGLSWAPSSKLWWY